MSNELIDAIKEARAVIESQTDDAIYVEDQLLRHAKVLKGIAENVDDEDVVQALEVAAGSLTQAANVVKSFRTAHTRCDEILAGVKLIEKPAAGS